MSVEKQNLSEKFATFSTHWTPKIVAQLNGQDVKASKFKGEFVWHSHVDADEMFLVHRGSFRMEFRDRTVTLSAGDFIVVPRGVEHKPVADEEVEVILFEPAGTLNTGNADDARALPELERI
jgi:mannose-6-phosphate isomerase-like protein (cupin superfamily)